MQWWQSKKAPHAEEIAHDAQEDDEQYGLSRDEVRDGTFDTSSPEGNKKGTLKHTDKDVTSGSNNKKRNVVETSKPNQVGNVLRKRANIRPKNKAEKVVRRITLICHQI